MLNCYIVKLKRLEYGFTLIELLIVITLFALVAAGGSGMFISLIRNNQKSQTLLSLKREGDTAITAINREVTWAKGVSIPANASDCVEGESYSSITFQNVDDVDVTVSCTEGDSGAGSIILSKNSNNTNLINSDLGFDIKDCNLKCYSNLGRYSVGLSFTLANPSGSESQAFSMNTTMRNSQP